MTFGCDEARRWVDPWIDQELDPSAAMHVEAHMARCADCRAEGSDPRASERGIALHQVLIPRVNLSDTQPRAPEHGP